MLKLASRIREVRSRDSQPQPEVILRQRFSAVVSARTLVDAQFLDSTRGVVVGAAGMGHKAPVVAQFWKDAEISLLVDRLAADGQSVLVLGDPVGGSVLILVSKGEAPRLVGDAPPSAMVKLTAIFRSVSTWAGALTQQGEHVMDLTSPTPGPHFFVNLLLGNRIGFPNALQTTPKSVVDRLGRGSFRSHAATQVLATRWDMRAEENGFPANRQFYLVENGRQIFYSANPNHENVLSARASHGHNQTTIRYRTRCGLEITRLIFLLPHEDGFPLATEVQVVTIENLGTEGRALKLVATGMFGAAAPGALQEDVLFTNVSMQSRVLENPDGSVAAIGPDYNSAWNKEDVRFHTMIAHQLGEASFPKEFCTNYNEFVGEGTLEFPQGLSHLSNRLSRKGPGFFALAANLQIPAGDRVRVDNFTGLVSAKSTGRFEDETFVREISRLIERYRVDGEVDRALDKNKEFLAQYSRYLKVNTGEDMADGYVNSNLPFQILYQTFVSRSFCQTQKGYREIGFREIQDFLASMPLFVAMGQQDFARDLLKEWGGQIFEFGYAYHNFYWAGKEPGEFSDDALWFVQAVDAYLRETGNTAFLDEECEVAGTDGGRRTIYETIRAVLRYSGEISVGKHGLPLLDKADWNDTLRLDPDFLNGREKEEAYRRQLERLGKPGDPLESNYSESVMNGFLLKVAVDAAREMAAGKGDTIYRERLDEMSKALGDRLQRHTWKGDFFARVLINRFPDGRYTYLGAGGDGLSDDPGLDGTYFLNSFSWAILAGVATEEQIATMLGVLKRVLLTPHGLKLCSPVRYRDVTARGGSGEYFPGDRENGGVFKHANMMAVAAMLKASKEVVDGDLARELRDQAYTTIDVVMPFRTMKDPYVLCGNPRFCTQYNNSETGENIGPLLSGTSTWLWLALLSAYGIRVTQEGIQLDPLLREGQTKLELTLDTGAAVYHIEVAKPKGFYRVRDSRMRLVVDGKPVKSNVIPRFHDGRVHRVTAKFSSTGA